jgi:predicted phosphodiesterase
MAYLNWLHLSDWHQRGKEFDRKVVAKKLINDIKARKKIDEQLEHIDFIIFSGDIAFSGEREQFELANEQLIKPIRDELGKDTPIYFVPGNHDIQRSLFKKIPGEMAQVLVGENNTQIEELLQDELTIEHLNRPLANFYDFAGKHGCKYVPRKLYLVKKFEKEGHKIGIACLNTAWLSARSNIHPRAPDKKDEFWDRGVLRTTEAQIRDALEELSGSNIAIMVMHHPLHWLEETDQANAERMIGSDCHIVLHGHEHRPNMNRLSNAFGDVVIIPAGASYYRRNPTDPRYTNAYNFCSVDLESNMGTIFHRLWSDVNDMWRADERFWAEGRSHFFIQKKQPDEQQRMARRALNQLSKNYLQHVYKRPAILQDIALRHKKLIIDGELFIQARVRIKIKLYKGEAEQFPIRSLVNPRIASHTNPKVRAAAHQLRKFVPNPSALKWEKGNIQCEGYLNLGPNDQDIEYEFDMLETTDGLYYFNLRRFTERVRFNLIKDPYFEYEDLAFGGFPSLAKVSDEMFRADTWETNEPAMPNQGLVVQWYPKRPAKVDPTAANSQANEKKSPGKTKPRG